eukprot:g30417.t1
MGRKADYGQIDTEGFERCLGAGKIVGLFNNSSLECDQRGWGHLVSDAFQGTCFFHLQRSPSLRGYSFDPVLFEVVEINGRYEAVNMMLPSQLEDSEVSVEAQPFVGQRVEGQVKSKCKMVEQKMLAVQGEGVLKASALFNSQRSEFM